MQISRFELMQPRQGRPSGPVMGLARPSLTSSSSPFPTRALSLFLMLLLPALLPLAAATVAFAVKTEDFKRCDQASFCRRLRSLAPRQAAAAEGSWASPYRITGHGALVATGEEPDEPPSIVFPVRSALLAEGEAAFELKLDVLADGIVRVRLDEVGGLRQRYDEAARWALVDGALGRRASFDLNTDDHSTNVTFTSSFDGAQRLELTHEPLRLALFRADRSEPELVLNGRGLLHIEHFRPHPTAGASPAEPLAAAGEQGQTVLEPLAAASPPVDRSWFEGPKDEWERDLWEEKWKTWTDSKPKGALPAVGTTNLCPRGLIRLLLSLAGPLQVPRPFHSTSTSRPLRRTSTACPSTPLRFRSLRRAGPAPTSATRTGCSTSTSLSTSPTRP
jgi:alpha 1,3-glucosidase